MRSMKSPEVSVVGQKYARPDAVGKVTGVTQYSADLEFSGMLYGALHRSSEPRAKIVDLDVVEAEGMPGVVRVFTAKDVPGTDAALGAIGDVSVFAKDEVRWEGEHIALVVADTQLHAQAAAEKIKVHYESLPVVTDPVAAMEPGAPDIGQGVSVFGQGVKNNVISQLHTTRGDVEEGFETADIVLERVYRTQGVDHAYMERESAVAIFDGRVMQIHCGSQNIFSTQQQVAHVLGFNLSNVIVNLTPSGGSFGGKGESMNLVASLAAVASYHLFKPVLVEMTREQTMVMSAKRHPFVMFMKAGMKKDGTFTALQVKNVADTGAYVAIGPMLLARAHAQTGGPYDWRNWQVDSYSVLTNNGLGSAMRGFGNPQVIFAVESLIDELALQIDMDPIDLRLKNAFQPGSVTMTDQVLDTFPIHFSEVLNRVRKISNWDKKRREYAKDTGRYRRGIGVAAGWRGCAFGCEGYDWGSAIVTMQKDGTVSISCGTIETGQGCHAVMAQIAAETLGLTPDKVHYVPMATHVTPDMLTSSASRGTMIGGGAVKLASEEVRKRLFKQAAEVLKTTPEDLTAGDNKIWSRDSPDKMISYKELAHMVHWKQEQMSALSWYLPPKVTFNPQTGKGSTYYTYHWMAQVFEVTVDMVTGEVTIDQVYAVHDPGRVLNPDMARGQVLGALSFGIGYGLYEEVVIDNGRFQSGNFDTYRVVRAKDMPPVTLEFLNIPDPLGLYGAKSVGEPGLDLPGAAIPNAIAQATGYRALQLPVTPKRLLDGLKEVKP